MCDVVFGFDIVILYCVSFCSSHENKKQKIDDESWIALFVYDPDPYLLWHRVGTMDPDRVTL